MVASSGFSVSETTVALTVMTSITSRGMLKPKRARCMSWKACHTLGVVSSVKDSKATGISSS